MDKTKILVLMLIAFAAPAVAQDTTGNPDNEGSIGSQKPPQPATCGDNICQDVETGICPEDCGGPIERIEPNESDESFVDSNQTQIDQPAEENRRETGKLVAAASFTGLIILLVIVYLRRDSESESGQESLENVYT